MKLTLGAAAVLAALAIPTIASAHDATITCGDGAYVVTASHLNLSPVTTFGDSTATVVWSDGFTVTRPLPADCIVPGPPPVPPVPETIPVVLTPPPVVVVTPPLKPKPPAKPRTKPKPKPRISCTDLAVRGAGRGWYVRLGCPFRVTPRVAG